MKKYIVLENSINCSSIDDMYYGPFDSTEEAEEEARCLWNHLTSKERAHRDIVVACVDVEDGEDPIERALDEGYYEVMRLTGVGKGRV